MAISMLTSLHVTRIRELLHPTSDGASADLAHRALLCLSLSLASPLHTSCLSSLVFPLFSNSIHPSASHIVSSSCLFPSCFLLSSLPPCPCHPRLGEYILALRSCSPSWKPARPRFASPLEACLRRGLVIQSAWANPRTRACSLQDASSCIFLGKCMSFTLARRTYACLPHS